MTINKRPFLLIPVLLLFGFFHGQVGINTANPQTTLDVASDNVTAAGIIAPWQTRQQLIDNAAKYTAAQEGAIVYVTNTAGSSPATVKITQAGYYYFDGSIWQPFTSGGSASPDWRITGNAGTTRGTNFIGTTDGQDLVVKTNSQERMTISSIKNIGMGTASPASSLHVAGDMTLNKELRVGGTATTAGDAGTADQILVSQGSGLAPKWSAPTDIKGQTSIPFFVFSTGQSVNGSTTFNNVPGLSQTFVAPANGNLIIQTVIYTALGTDAGSTAGFVTFTNTQIVIKINGVETFYGMSTPMGIGGAGKNPECTTIVSRLAVTKGTSYTITVQAKDVYKFNDNGSVGAYAGTFNKNGYTAQSVMMGTFITM